MPKSREYIEVRVRRDQRECDIVNEIGSAIRGSIPERSGYLPMVGMESLKVSGGWVVGVYWVEMWTKRRFYEYHEAFMKDNREKRKEWER